MDSKSISRKGVGVQVPASAPHSWPSSDDFSRALVAVLLHKLANTTQYLSALNALLADDDAANALSTRVDGLASTAVEVDELGWILGLVANASGADLLLDRRRDDGLAALVALVLECVRREGGDLVMPGHAWPAIVGSSRADSWRTPWVCGQWLFAVGRSTRDVGRIEWELQTDSVRPMIVCHAPLNQTIERCSLELQESDPRLDFELGARRCTLLLPAGVLASGVRS